MGKVLKEWINRVLFVVCMISCNGVETVHPKKTAIIDAVFASGHIITDHEYQVTANTEGYLIKSFVDEGDTVEAGMPLFQLSNEIQSENVSNAKVNYQDAIRKLGVNAPERVQLELQIEQAHSQMLLDKKNYHRYQKLLATKAVSQMEFEKIKLQYENSVRNVDIQEKALSDLVNSLELNAQNARTQLSIQQETNNDYFVFATIDGVPLNTVKERGELVRRGEVVAAIGGGGKLAKLYVAEEDIHEVRLAQEVIINLNTEKGKMRTGAITKIYPSFDEAEQSFIVEASLGGDVFNIYHNTQLQANIIVNEKEDVFVIPSWFLLDGDSVILKGGERRYIEVGITNDQWIEVLEGLDQTDILQEPSAL